LATKHIEAALAYEPTDKKLADALKQAKRMFSGELSHGTGWIAAADGYVMTNNHVIEGDGKPYVVLADGETEVRAKIIARDPERDMAILKIDVPDGLSWDPRPISSKLPRAASEVCVLGFPLNAEDLKFARGAVAGLPDSSNDEMIELDCRVNPGNSGGPMCDPAGNVLGMVTAKTVRVDPTIDTIGMAIPTSYLLAFLKEHVPDFEPAELAELPPSPDWADMYENAKPTVMKIVMKRV